MYTSRTTAWTWYVLIGLGLCFLIGAALILRFADADWDTTAYIWIGVGALLGGIGGFGLRKNADAAKLLEDGTRTTATILGVKNTGILINSVPRFLFRVRVDRAGAPFEAEIDALTYSPAAIGSVLAVCYDPKNIKHIAFADVDAAASTSAVTSMADSAATSAPGDAATTVELLAQLDKMHQSGALSDDEFKRAKNGVLGTS